MGDDSEWLKLPTDEKCQHKAWKARVAGYEEAIKLFNTLGDEKSPEFSKYLGLIKKFVIDNNAVAQEKGLEATLVFIENSFQAPKTAGEVCCNVIAKCLNQRAKTQALGVSILMAYIEAEKQEIVQEELLKGLTNKQPKVVSMCVVCLREALRDFGPKVISIKPMVKQLHVLLEDRDKGVRDEAKMLTIEIYRWIGQAIKPQLTSVKPVQIAELEAEFEKLPANKPQQTRFLRSQQDLKTKIMQQNDQTDSNLPEGGDGPHVTNDIDPYELLEAVDIISKIPKDFYEKIEEKKWQDRKEALEGLQKVCDYPKYENGDFNEILRTLRKVIAKDSNVMLVAIAAKCVTLIATGLRKKFAIHASNTIEVILEKFKEKKQNVVLALREAADACFLTTNLEGISEPCIVALDHKTPSVKAETASFLARCFLKCTPITLPKKMLKLFVTAFLKTVNDTAPEVREASYEALGTAMKIISEKALLPFLADIDHLKMAKIKECCDKVMVVGKGPTASGEAHKLLTINHQQPSSKLNSAGPPKKPEVQNAAVAPSAAVKKKPNTATISKKSNTNKKEVLVEKELSEEEVDEKMLALFPGDVMPGLANNNWKDRLASMERIIEKIKTMPKEDIPTQVIMRNLIKKPGLKDNNFQVLKLKVELISLLSCNAKMSQRCGDYVLSDLIDKIGDSKNGEGIKECLSNISEATSLDYVAQQVLSNSIENKNPKNQSEALLWMANSIKEFGLKVNVKPIVEVIKKALISPNPNTRTGAINLIGVMHMFIGPTIRVLFESEKPAVLQLIDAEILKVKDEKAPTAVRGLKSTTAAADEDGGGDGDEKGDEQSNVPNLADLVTRVDISDKVTEQLLTELSDKDWKVRKETLEKIQTFINDAKFIEPNIGNLVEAMKLRLTESNKILAMIALNICQLLSQAVGPNIKQYARSMAPGIISNLADAKPNVRAVALGALNSLVDVVGQNGLANLVEAEIFSDALKVESPMLRTELLGWMSERLPKYKKLPTELLACIVYLYACLEDRNADVRKKANEAVMPFMLHCGYDAMLNKVSAVKPSSKDVVQKALELARSQLPAKPQKSVAPSSSSISANSKYSHGDELNDKLPGKSNQESKAKGKSMAAGEKKTAAGGGGGGGATMKKKQGDEDDQPAMKSSNGKEQRAKDEKNLKVLKWNFDIPRKEFLEQLQLQMEPTFNKVILDQLFHPDFKLQIKAIDVLIKSCEESLQPTISNYDLILKWITLRFFDTNTTILLKCLEYLLLTMHRLTAQSYQLTDIEAVSFIPYLVNKVGDPKDNIRKDVRSAMQLLCNLYSLPKVTNYILDGLKSKNAKQRAECLEELGSMVQNYGLNIFQPSVGIALKLIASQISDRENNVRSAALNCVVNVYNIVGEAVFKQIGTLNEKDMSMLEERIKRSVKLKPGSLNTTVQNNNEKMPTIMTNDAKKSNLRPNSALANPLMSTSAGVAAKAEQQLKQPQQRREGGIYLELEDDDVGKALVIPKLIEPNIDDILNQPIHLPVTRSRISPHTIRILQKSPDAKIAIDIVISQIPNHDVNACLGALNQLDVVLRDKSQNESLVGHMNQIITMCTMQLRLILSNYLSDPARHRDAIRLTKSILALFDSICKVPVLAKEPKRDVIKDLHYNLVSILNDQRLNEMTEKTELLRTINIIVMKIIDSMDLTNTLCALIKLMQELVSNDSTQHLDLVMKSIWHLVRTIPVKIDNLNVDELLLEMHLFLKINPSSSFKNRPSDLPLRTIKTVLHHLANTKKEKSTDCDSAWIPLLCVHG